MIRCGDRRGTAHLGDQAVPTKAPRDSEDPEKQPAGKTRWGPAGRISMPCDDYAVLAPSISSSGVSACLSDSSRSLRYIGMPVPAGMR